MKLYEDRIVTAELPGGLVHGHVVVRPQKKVASLGELSEAESAHLFQVASYVAAILFQGIQAEGTNIIAREEPLVVHILARRSDDGLNLQWEPTEAEWGDVHERVKEKAFYVGKEAPQSDSPAAEEQREDGDENYLIKHLIKTV